MSGIFINSDAWNFWLDNQGNMTADAVRKDVEFYAAQGGVEGIFYNMNFQRSFYPTKVGTPIWKDCEILEDGSVTLRGEKLPPDVADEYRAMIAGGKELNEKVPEAKIDFLVFQHREEIPFCRRTTTKPADWMTVTEFNYHNQGPSAMRFGADTDLISSVLAEMYTVSDYRTREEKRKYRRLHTERQMARFGVKSPFGLFFARLGYKIGKHFSRRVTSPNTRQGT